MTEKELQKKQAWTLEQKIDHSIGTIEAFINRTGKIPFFGFICVSQLGTMMNLRQILKSRLGGDLNILVLTKMIMLTLNGKTSLLRCLLI